MSSLYILGFLCAFFCVTPHVTAADFALVGELNILSVGSHISMGPMNTLDFNRLDLGSIGDPLGIDFDPVAGRIYWTDFKKGTITRARLNGGNKQILFSNAQGPHGITLDKEKRLMYWTEEGRRSIWRANLDGTNRTRIISTGLKVPGDMQLDPVENRLYWIDENGIHSQIESAKVDGSDRKTLIVNNLHRNWLKHPTGISLDIVGRKMFWCDDKLDYIGSADLNGSNPLNLFQKSSWWLPDLLYQPESIAVYGKHVYFVELMSHQLKRIPKDGSRKPQSVGKVDTVLFIPYGPLQGPVDLFIHSDIQYCNYSPCKQGGKCVGGSGWYRCNCLPGTTGPLCEQDIPLSPIGVNPQANRGGGSVGGIVGGILLVVLILILIAVVCYRRGRGDGRSENDTVPIVFAIGNQPDPPIAMGATASTSKSKAAEFEEAQQNEKGQHLGACGSPFDDPPSYDEATEQTRISCYEKMKY